MREQSSEHMSGRASLGRSKQARPSSAVEPSLVAGAVEFCTMMGHLARMPELISPKVAVSQLDLPSLSRV
ncbi:hypothetical protein SDC9_137283 [bioreactor metagenome]|uniref:Uncharacterized protein n=1 Tax=bioreactor metagenome TaxID=1076179 RepID=A0A645DLG1_9ZZZZ